MLHEDLKTDIVCKDRSTFTATPALVVVRLTGVNFAQQEPGLASSLLCINVPGKGIFIDLRIRIYQFTIPWDWESVEQNLLGFGDRSFQQLLEIGILWLWLVLV